MRCCGPRKPAPGGLLAIEGPPGIGKTSLLDAARARAKGLGVVAAAGSELERGTSTRT
jgi:hypothetical protein